jgi:c-di-GMP-binding flagellar brake protein YcgR
MLIIGESESPVIFRGMVSDISIGGAGLYLVKPVEVGIKAKLEIRFLVAYAGIKTAIVRGKTVYSYPFQDTYYVGIQFDQELNPKDQPDLYNRIQHILESF